MEHDYLTELKARIRNCEERFISYKKMLEDVHRDKAAFPPDDPFVIWHKDSLRESKNQEEKWLDRLREERTYYPGLTPTQTREWLERYKRECALKEFRASLERGLASDDLAHVRHDIEQLLTKLP